MLIQDVILTFSAFLTLTTFFSFHYNKHNEKNTMNIAGLTSDTALFKVKAAHCGIISP